MDVDVVFDNAADDGNDYNDLDAAVDEIYGKETFKHPILKPIGQKFFNDHLNRSEFCQSKAKNCCCRTCQEAQSTFDVHLPLFFADCKTLYSSLVNFLTLEEAAVDLLGILVVLKTRMMAERDFLLSDGKLCK